MSIYSDLKCDALEIWSSSGWITRIVLAFSLFFTTSSIASLSDTIFVWRGFFLEAKIFYHRHVIEPLIELGKYFNLHISDNEADGFIVITVLISSNIRAITESYKKDYLENKILNAANKMDKVRSTSININNQMSLIDRNAIDNLARPELTQQISWGVLAFLLYSIYFYISGSIYDHGHEFLIGFIGLYLLFLFDLLWAYKRSVKIESKELRKIVNLSMRRKIFLFISVPLFSLTLVGVFAAINSGLEKSL